MRGFVLEDSVPHLGICPGMQSLAEKGVEQEFTCTESLTLPYHVRSKTIAERPDA